MENDEVARRRELSERRGRRGRPGAQRGLDERLPWMRQSDGTWIDGKKASAHPYLARQMSDFGFRQNP